MTDLDRFDAPFRLVGVSGSTSAQSKTSVLVARLLDAVETLVPTVTETVLLADLAATIGTVHDPRDAPGDVALALRAIEQADLLVVATPVRHGGYAGLFKHLFDLVDRRALEQVPVLLGATGSTARHSLVIDQQLRPLFAALHAIALPVGVFVHDGDFERGRLVSDAASARIARAAAGVVPLLPVLRREACGPSIRDPAPV